MKADEWINRDIQLTRPSTEIRALIGQTILVKSIKCQHWNFIFSNWLECKDKKTSAEC